jgi:molybdenum cofactor synthesis domain-containing protein
MDGFAVSAGDLESATSSAPVQLRLVGEVGLGSKTGLKVGRGEAAKIATGAPLPEGADTVVPVEQATEKEGQVMVAFAPEKGRWVYDRGSDLQKGELVVPRGRPIRAQDVGMLLSLGLAQTPVYVKPRVAILATGSELTNRPSKEGKVRNSHSPIFLRLARSVGAEPVDSGIAKDIPREVARKLRGALGRSDMVITLGGTSAGKHDVVDEAISSLHPEILFHGIKIERGRVAGFAVVRGKPLLMLPGPIQGAMTAFLLLGIPTIDLLSGRTGGFPSVSATMKSEWRAREKYSGFTKVFYVRLQGEALNVAQPIAGDTESMSVLAKADGFVVVPEEITGVSAGERVEVRLLPGFSFA